MSIAVRIVDVAFPAALPFGESATLSFQVLTAIAEHPPIFDPLPTLRIEVTGATSPRRRGHSWPPPTRPGATR
ncbi:MAG TPA: hypothetical protein VMT79_13235 [Candidatus Binatia bacterium]|nr:hypothetical protein [Candidatus Binatia bacterium]